MSKKKTIDVWVSVGGHGHIFEFLDGPVASKYPNLMWVFSEKTTDDLLPAKITYEFPDHE